MPNAASAERIFARALDGGRQAKTQAPRNGAAGDGPLRRRRPHDQRRSRHNRERHDEYGCEKLDHSVPADEQQRGSHYRQDGGPYIRVFGLVEMIRFKGQRSDSLLQ